MKRAIVLVLDGCGVGALPDAAGYGDEGTNTLGHVAQAVGGLELPTLERLGLGSITALEGVERRAAPEAVHGRLHALGPGKDSISGHWELMGVVAERPLPTYPDGFPPPLLTALERACRHELIGNLPCDGIAAIERFGEEHLRTGALILYTSQDSVLQLAAHVERVERAELYRACAAARAVMSGEHAVGRVIARPFSGLAGAFERAEGRRDFALAPPARSHLQALEQAGVAVHGVGKIGDLFAGVGITDSHPGASNAQALASVDRLLREGAGGLVLANLIETDQTFGHRKDVRGFQRALEELDAYLAGLLERLAEGDLLIVTADHGVDPAHPGSDHTREHVPLLALSGEMIRGGAQRAAAPGAARGDLPLAARRHDGPLADVGASVLRWLTGAQEQAMPGRAFMGEGRA